LGNSFFVRFRWLEVQGVKMIDFFD